MRWRLLLTFFAVAAVVAAALSLGVWGLPPYPAPSEQAKVLRVLDGDTIEVRLSDGTVERVRYLGINTPELPAECFAREAWAINRSLVEGRTVHLEADAQDRDQYGRLLRYVYLDPQGYAMVNLLLLAVGAAEVEIYEPNTRYAAIFEAVEQTARAQKLGKWTACASATTLDVRITRLLPNPSGPEPDDEWIEVCNFGSAPANIAGWALTDNEGIYKFPAGTTIQPQGQDRDCLKVYGSTYNPTGDKKGLFLANKRDEVILLDDQGKEVDRCEYEDAGEDVIIVCE